MTTNKYSGVSTKAGLTLPCSSKITKLHKHLCVFNATNYTKYNEKKDRDEVRGVGSSKYSSIFASGVLEYVAKVLCEESLRHWASDSYSSNRINCNDIHSMITSPNNMDLNVLFPFPTLERARDVTSLERKLHDMNKKLKQGKDINESEYSDVVNSLREKSPLNMVDADGRTKFKWHYDGRKLKYLMKQMYSTIEIHTHKQPDTENEGSDPVSENEDKDKDEQNSMTINENAKVYINVLMEDFIGRFVDRLARHVTQTCGSDESLNHYSKSRKKADLRHVRFVFETLLYGDIMTNAFTYAKNAVDTFIIYETENNLRRQELREQEGASGGHVGRFKKKETSESDKPKEKSEKSKDTSDKPKEKSEKSEKPDKSDKSDKSDKFHKIL